VRREKDKLYLPLDESCKMMASMEGQ